MPCLGANGKGGLRGIGGFWQLIERHALGICAWAALQALHAHTHLISHGPHHLANDIVSCIVDERLAQISCRWSKSCNFTLLWAEEIENFIPAGSSSSEVPATCHRDWKACTYPRMLCLATMVSDCLADSDQGSF